MIHIYALSNPDDISDVKYIGQTTNPSKRLLSHIRQAKEKNYSLGKNEWIGECIKKNKQPIISSIDFSDNRIEASVLEMQYVAMFKFIGIELFNERNTSKTIYSDKSRSAGSLNAMFGKKGVDNPNFGSKRNPETGKRISAARKGKPCVGLYKKIKMIDSKTGEVLRIFDSALHVELELNYKKRMLTRVARGTRKIAYGYKWSY